MRGGVAPYPFPLRIPRHPAGEPLPAASEAFAGQVRTCIGVPGVAPDGVYLCDSNRLGVWEWRKLSTWGQAISADILTTGLVSAGDMAASDDLTVGDDAAIGGDLTVAGTVNGVVIPQATGEVRLFAFSGGTASAPGDGLTTTIAQWLVDLPTGGTWELLFWVAMTVTIPRPGEVTLIVDDGQGASVVSRLYAATEEGVTTLLLNGVRSNLTSDPTLRVRITNAIATDPVAVHYHTVSVVARRTA